MEELARRLRFCSDALNEEEKEKYEASWYALLCVNCEKHEKSKHRRMQPFHVVVTRGEKIAMHLHLPNALPTPMMLELSIIHALYTIQSLHY